MTKKEITLCGKQVTLAYCFATEIGYKVLAEEDITVFMQDAIDSLQNGKMPDTQRTIFALIAAMSAYYESVKQEMPLIDEDIMYTATPTEIGTAIGTFISLRAEFYHIPAGEPKDKPKKGTKRKNS